MIKGIGVHLKTNAVFVDVDDKRVVFNPGDHIDIRMDMHGITDSKDRAAIKQACETNHTPAIRAAVQAKLDADLAALGKGKKKGEY